MNKKLKEDWVAALRSGEYLQGESVLYSRTPREDRYCCLGVLHVVEHGHEGWRKPREDSNCYLSCHGDAQVYGSPQHFGDDIHNALLLLNDRMKASFATIAEWIEKNVPA